MKTPSFRRLKSSPVLALSLAAMLAGIIGSGTALAITVVTPASDFGATTSADDVDVQGTSGTTTTTGNSSGNNLLVAAGTGTLFQVGQAISGTGIPNNSWIVSISADTLRLAGQGLPWYNLSFNVWTVPASTVITPYNQVSAQPTADVNKLTLSGDGSAVTLQGGAILSIFNGVERSGGSTAIAAISGGAGIQVGTVDANLTISTPAANDSLVLNTAILANGTGGLSKTGPGTLTLRNASNTANTYTGKTVIDGGTLAIFRDTGVASPNLGTVPASFQTDNITLQNGATLAYDNNFDRTKALTLEANRGVYLGSGMQTFERVGNLSFAINGAISGPGGLVVKYDSTLDAGGGANFDLNAANTYSGDTTFAMAAGQNKGWNFRVGHSLALQNSTLDYSNAGNIANTVMTPSFSVATATFGGLKGGVIAGSVRTFVLPTTSLSVGNNNQSTTYAGTMSGTGALIKIGSGTLTLSAGNTYTGGTTITGGTLELTASNAAGTGTIMLNGGTLLLGNNTVIQNNILGSSGTGTLITTTGVDTPTIGGLTGSVAVVLPSNITSLTLNVVSGTATYAADLGNGAAGMNVIKTGGGAQMLGSASYDGATTVTAGALSFAKQISFKGSMANLVPANITVASGAALGLGVGDPVSGYFDSAAIDTVLDASHLGNSDASTGLTPGAQIGLDTTNATAGTFTRSTAIGDLVGGNSLGLAKLGVGTLVLDAANTYSGTTTVYAGTLQVGVGQTSVFGTSPSLVFSAGSTGKVQLNDNSMTLVGLNTNATVGTPIVENGGATAVALTINSAANSTYGGKLQNGSTGTLALLKSGSAALTLSGTANAYTGKTVIDGGTLKIAADGSLGTSPGTAQTDNITINNGAILQKTISGNTILSANRGIVLGSGIQTLMNGGSGWLNVSGAISGSGGLDIKSDVGNDVRIAGVNTYTGDTRIFSNMGMNNAMALQYSTLDYNSYGGSLNYLTSSGYTAVTFGGLKGGQALAFGTVALSIGNNNSNTAYSGVLSSTGGSLNKIGTGTLTLGGNNSYSGPTNVNVGTLLINGTGTATNTGALTVAPLARLGGNGSTPSAVTIQSGGKFLVDISDWTGLAGTGFSDLSVATLNLTDVTWVVNVSSATAYANFADTTTTFPFLTATGGITGFNTANVSVSAAGFPGSGTWSVQKSTDGLTLELVYTTSGTASPYDNWAFIKGLDGTPGKEKGLTDDPDGDGHNNLAEFAFNGDPLKGSDNGQVYVLQADSDADTPDTNKELILTLAVRKTTGAFTAGAPATASSVADGISYAIEGSLDLSGFGATVTPVGFVDPGVALTDATYYEYRSFSLSGSNGLPTKGFLRAKAVK